MWLIAGHGGLHGRLGRGRRSPDALDQQHRGPVRCRERGLRRALQRQGWEHRPGHGTGPGQLGRRVVVLPGQEHQAAHRRRHGRPAHHSERHRLWPDPRGEGAARSEDRRVRGQGQAVRRREAKNQADRRGLPARIRQVELPRRPVRYGRGEPVAQHRPDGRDRPHPEALAPHRSPRFCGFWWDSRRFRVYGLQHPSEFHREAPRLNGTRGILEDQRVRIYDTTLRDGTQGEDVSFSVEDKLRIARALDELGIAYIEGGWPGSNPRDAAFFEAARREKLSQAKYSAFGSTRKTGVPAAKDPLLKALLATETPVACIFGKSWSLHARDALGVSLEENLELIFDTVRFLKKHVDEVVYDAEHFFDGFADNRDYALSTLKSAADAGADVIVLCDTNGGTMPAQVTEAIAEVKKRLPDLELGIHAHNDSEVAVANTLAAVEGGIRHVQGTINGFGERCGNANLVSIIPNLQVKLGYQCVPKVQLANLKSTSRLLFELLNQPPNKRQPYVGDSAFAHKGGVHVSAVLKNARTYEHVDPASVGNRRRVLVSDLSGRSNVLFKAKEWGVDLGSKDPETQAILTRLKELESQGFEFEGAEASFELLMKDATGHEQEDGFRLIGFRVIAEKRSDDLEPLAEAT